MGCQWMTPNRLIAIGALSVILPVAPKVCSVFLMQCRTLPLPIAILDPFVFLGVYLGWRVKSAADTMFSQSEEAAGLSGARAKIVMGALLGTLGMFLNVLCFMAVLAVAVFDAIK
jgi:hypothetical protein